LAVYDGLVANDYGLAKKILTASASDYAVADSASVKGAVPVGVNDYGLSADFASLSNRSVQVYDLVPVQDYGNAAGAKAVEAKDYLPTADYAEVKKVAAVSAFDAVLADSTSSSRSYSPILFGMLKRTVSISYYTLQLLDMIATSDAASTKKFVSVSAGDYGLTYEGSQHMRWAQRQ
jgi:hypothetical protein